MLACIQMSPITFLSGMRNENEIFTTSCKAFTYRVSNFVRLENTPAVRFWILFDCR